MKKIIQHKNAAKIKNNFARTNKIIIIATFSAERRAQRDTFVITPDSPIWAVDRTSGYRARLNCCLACLKGEQNAQPDNVAATTTTCGE